MPGLSQQPRRALTWKELCRDPDLHDLPYKIETNDRGQVVMSPVFSRRSFYQSDLITLMADHLPEGRTAVEFAVRTSKGTKVADVAWLSPDRAAKAEGTYDTPLAPEICVEVLSPTNTTEEIEEKKRLYFEAGGHLLFFGPEGERDVSECVPGFPRRLDD